ERRVAGEPTHYLLGAREFYGLPMKVDPRVLIPRPETEQLVELALAALPEHEEATALDLCTGSGCIAVALAKHRPKLKVVATDASSGALEVAKANVEANGVADRVELRRGDLFAPVAGMRFHVVATNPPYVASAAIDGLMREVRQEPRTALDGGADGLGLVRRIAPKDPRHPLPGGALF
ncbi:MAG: peptide chain release factor N(5)-glutamine methyltransferase, partial [Myxococcales bacterium]